MKQLVQQNEYGGYSGPAQDLLESFEFLEENPNFDVFDTGNVRLILGKCSRIADDEDLTVGRFGIDLHRAIPQYEEAQSYTRKLPGAIKNRSFTGNLAFAAETKELYEEKLDVYNRFYSFVKGEKPSVMFAAPHSGDVKRWADRYVPFPKQEIDAWAGNIAALCADSFTVKPDRRIMVSVHSHFFPGPVIDIGDFGLSGSEKLRRVIRKLENKYHDKLQDDRQKRADDTAAGLLPRLEKVFEFFGSKSQLSGDRFDGSYISRGIRLYKVEIPENTLDGFREALTDLGTREVIGIGYGKLYTGRKVSGLIGLQKMVDDGLLDGAVQIEISRAYGKVIPELIAQMINDLVHDYFFSAE